MAKIHRLRKWAWLWNPGYRQALKVKRQIDAGAPTQVLDYTDGGTTIVGPTELAHLWDELPAEVRSEFMATLDARRGKGESGQFYVGEIGL